MGFAIFAEGLTKSIGWFPSRLLVDHLDLKLEEGRIFGLLGPNGAGKTTTFKLLMGLSRISSGRALLFDVPVPTPASRVRVGYLPEVVNHPDYLTVGEYLVYYAELAGLTNIQAGIKSALSQTGLPAGKALNLSTLSKGMRQRVDLARVLMLDSKLILLDEPVSGLDPMGQAMLKELLVGLRKKGISILLNSHSVSMLSDLCDEIGILCQGKMMCSGTLNTLLATNRRRLILDGSLKDPLSVVPDRKKEETSTKLHGDRWQIDLVDRGEIGPILKKFLEVGMEVVETYPVRLSLEELFTRTVAPSEQTHQGGTP